jgi:hypothetical protein
MTMAMAVTPKIPRLDATQARGSKAMGGSVVANKPPPASQHRAVLLSRKDVPLFDMRVNSSVNARGIIVSSSNARRMMMVETISTNRVSGVKDPRYMELMVSFYTRAVNYKNISKKLTNKLIMPKDWTPRMYLGALNRSIMNNAILSLELVALDQQSYTATNKLHWLLFSSPVDAIHMRLTTSAAYLRVAGGNYQSKSPQIFS